MHLLLCLLFVILAFSNALEWKTLDDALTQAKKSESLVLFYMSKTKCKPCKKLNEQFESNEEFAELSKYFVLAKAVDELPKSEDFKLDGKYVPKVVFLNSNGVVLTDVVNKDAKSQKAKYFYSKIDHVIKSMNKAWDLSNLDHGFGKDYIWYDWNNGLKTALEQNKPILAVFHQDWCGACQRLKPKFAESEEIKKYASEFVMINTDDEEIVKGDKYKADGEYYPKIVFLDSSGEHYAQEWNHGTKHTHVLHYYGDGEEISKSMIRVIENRTLTLAKDNGFGKHIRWVKYEHALKLAQDQKKPIMLIIHKSYCGACKALKPRIRNDEEIAELSKQFIMVNCEDDDEPIDDQFDQDGAYIPRVFFLDNNGKVEVSIFNPSDDYKKAKYAFGSAQSIVEAMKKALSMQLGERKPVAEQTSDNQQQQQQQQQQEQQQQSQPDPTDGFGNEIKWYAYEEGLREAKKSHKPVMIVFYNDYCQFSAFLKEQFRDSPQILQQSRNFVMIKVGEEEAQTLGDKFDIDGKYTPRIFFMDPDQNIHREVNNTDSQYTSTLFYYGTAGDIVKGMNLALEKINLTLGRGFGEYITWYKYEKALEVAKEMNMPMMLIIHKSWCGACSALKPIIANSRSIWKLTPHFVMVNVEDEEEPLDNQYFIDGGYYPRIFFLDSNGKVHHDLHNRDPAFLKYKFSFSSEEQILHAMRFAIHKLVSHVPLEQQQQQTTSNTQTSENTELKLSPGKKLLAESGASWVTIDEALVQSKESRKPILFLIHRTTCPACKAVIKMISRTAEFKEKALPFILADIEDDVDEAKADSYDVDGGYVPRLYFLGPDGEIFKDIWNKGTNYLENKYYYYEMNSIYRSMEKTLALLEKGTTTNEQKDEL